MDTGTSLAAPFGTKDHVSIRARSQDAPKLTEEKQVPGPRKATPLASWSRTSPAWGLWVWAAPTSRPAGGHPEPGRGHTGRSDAVWVSQPSSVLKWN